MKTVWLFSWVFFVLVRKYHVKPETANRQCSERITVSGRVLLSQTNISRRRPLSSHTLFSFFSAWSNVSNAAFLLLSICYHWWNASGSGLLFAPFLTPCDLAILSLFRPIFSCSSQCFDSIIDVHEAQFTSRAFSIISLVNSLPVPCFSAACFLWREGRAFCLCSPCLRSHSISQAHRRCDKLHPFASKCNAVHV